MTCYEKLQPKQRRFLACFAVCSSVTRAARWSKVARDTHYKWLDDKAYADAFAATERVAARSLEDEAVRRAHEGLRKAIRYKGKIVGYETEYSDTLLQALLKANAPDKFRDRQSVDHSGEIVVKRVVGVPDDAV